MIFSQTNGIGEAPQLPCGTTATSSCSTYAEYDDGASVFTNYWNFAGTTLPSTLTEITTSSSSFSIDNGANWLTAGQATTLYSTSTINPANLIAEGQAPMWGSAIGWSTTIPATASDFNTWTNGYFAGLENNAPPNFVGAKVVAGAETTLTTAIGSLGDPNIGIAWLATGNEQFISNDGTPSSSSTDSSLTLANAYLTYGTGLAQNTGTSYWLRTRAYPPNGVMPSVTFGAVQAQVSLSISPNPATYGQAVTLTATCVPSTDTCAIDYPSLGTAIATGTGSATYTWNTTKEGIGTFSSFYANDITQGTNSTPQSLTTYVPINIYYANATSSEIHKTLTPSQVINLTTYFPIKLNATPANDILYNISFPITGETLNPSGGMFTTEVVYTSSTSLSTTLIAPEIVIDSGVTLTTNGYNLITNDLVNNGTIDTGYDPYSGGGGGTGSGGSGTSITTSFSGSGGGGGGATGSCTNQPGGNGGSTQVSGGTAPSGDGSTPSTASLTYSYVRRLIYVAVNDLLGGAGGGGGGGSGTCGQGGSGGSGGSGIIIYAHTITTGGTIIATGQNGNSGTNSGGSYGGGGAGGGGGTVVIIYNTSTSLPTVNVAGGSGGAGGQDGGSGGSGSYIKIQVAATTPIVKEVSNSTILNYVPLSMTFGIPFKISEIESNSSAKPVNLYTNVKLNATIVPSAFNFSTPIQYFPILAHTPAWTAKPSSWEIIPANEPVANQQLNTSAGAVFSSPNLQVNFTNTIKLNYPFTSFYLNFTNNPKVQTSLTLQPFKFIASNTLPASPYTRNLTEIRSYSEYTKLPLNTNTSYSVSSLFNNYTIQTTGFTALDGDANSVMVYMPQSNYANPIIFLSNQTTFSTAGTPYYGRENNYFNTQLSFGSWDTKNIYLPPSNVSSPYGMAISSCTGVAATGDYVTILSGPQGSQLQVQQEIIPNSPSFAVYLVNSYLYQFDIYSPAKALVYKSAISSWTSPISLPIPCNVTVTPITLPNVNATCNWKPSINGTLNATCTGVDLNDLVNKWKVEFINQSTVLTSTVMQTDIINASSFSVSYLFPSNHSSYSAKVVAMYGKTIDPTQTFTFVINPTAIYSTSALGLLTILFILAPIALAYFDKNLMLIVYVAFIFMGQALGGIFTFLGYSTFDVIAFIVFSVIMLIISELR